MEEKSKKAHPDTLWFQSLLVVYESNMHTQMWAQSGSLHELLKRSVSCWVYDGTKVCFIIVQVILHGFAQPQCLQSQQFIPYITSHFIHEPLMLHLTNEVLVTSLICSSAAAALFTIMVTSTHGDSHLNVEYMHNLLPNAMLAVVLFPAVIKGSVMWILLLSF